MENGHDFTNICLNGPKTPKNIRQTDFQQLIYYIHTSMNELSHTHTYTHTHALTVGFLRSWDNAPHETPKLLSF